MGMQRIHIEGVLDEDPEKVGRLIHFTKVVGRPQDLSGLLSMFTVHGVTINRIIVAVPFADLSQDAREILLRYEKSGSIELDMFEERLGFGSTVGALPCDFTTAENTNSTAIGSETSLFRSAL